MIIRGLSCVFPFLLSFANAQIQTDGSLGSAQTLRGPNYVINEDLGRRAGNNLFHSFGEFNIHGGESATFNGTSDIVNVIGRVTGGKLSTIDGLLKSEIPNANLYLINPAGLLFGPNASLSINGSFHTSTADFMRLGDADLFYSEPLQGEILSTAAPTAFGFFEASKGSITVAGSQLDLDDKATLSLVGGNVTIEDDARIHIPQGQINVVGVHSVGEAVFDVSAADYQDLDVNDPARLNNVSITNSSELNVDGEGGGRIVIRGGQLVLKESAISARTTGKADGAGVHITADHLDFVRSRLDTTTTGSGSAGEILLDAETLAFSGLGESGGVGLFANSVALVNPEDAGPGIASSGKAGIINITADQVDVLGDIAIEATAVLPENIGMIDLSTPELTLDGFDAEFQFNEGIGEIIRFTDGNIVLDGSLHPDRDGDVLTGPNYEITADMGRTSGNNLFHSFRDFFVDEGERVTFLGPEAGSATVSNIIARVTGENATNIYGDLITDIPEADLYLINPNGLFFGPSATLNLPSSFNAGTADYLDLVDGGRFDVSFPDESIFDGSELRAYGFRDDEIGEIIVEGRLFLNDTVFMSENITISLIGGNLQLRDDSRVAAFSGQVNLVSLRSEGEVSIVNGSNDLDVSGFSVLGDISIVDDSAVSATNSDFNSPAGRLFVRGNDLRLDNNGELRARNFGNTAGGSIDVHIVGDFFIEKESGIEMGGVGILGKISIEAENITIDGAGQEGFTGIEIGQLGETNGGENNLIIKANQTLNILNGGEINTSTTSAGNAGSITVQAKNLVINGLGTGILALSAINTTGNSGEIDITVEEQLYILNGGLINTSTFGVGNAGSITVRAKALTIDGQGFGFVGIGSIAGPHATSNGGDLDISVTEQLKIINSGIIDTSTFGAGDAGSITIRAKNLTIDGQDSNLTGIGSVAVSDFNSNGGNLDIIVTERFESINGGAISAFAETGNAGNLRILAGDNIHIENSSLSISAGQENFDVNDLDDFQQPELRLEAGNSIRIENSILSTDAGVLGSGRGAGGDIYLIAPTEIRLENSTLLAQAGYAGGNVLIDPIRYIVISSDVIAQADVLGGNYSVIVTAPSGWIQSADSLINLSGEQSGTILSNVSPFDLGAELSDLDAEFLNVEDWVSQPCKFRLGGSGSSFIVTGWRGVVNKTDDFLPSELILLADYELSETELIAEESLRKLMFPDVDNDCEDCL